jgi:methionine-rich copper-binding protein CopC
LKPIRSRIVRIPALLALLAAAPILAAAVAARPVHLELQKSNPADGSTVESVPEIRLWFTAAPMAMGPKTVELRIFDGAGTTLLAMGNPVRDPDDPKVYSLPFRRGLEPRAYTIAWQTMADDGDVVKGEFRFTVAAN